MDITLKNTAEEPKKIHNGFEWVVMEASSTIQVNDKVGLMLLKFYPFLMQL